MWQARREWKRSGKVARVSSEFRYRTRETGTRVRRVVGKAEYLEKATTRASWLLP